MKRMRDGKRGRRMSDLIKRETVLAFVRRCKDRLQGKGMTYDILVDYIESIPSAERKGEWIYCEDDEGQDGYRCSECGFFVPWYYDYEDSNYILDYKACPHCLTRMKGADDEEL